MTYKRFLELCDEYCIRLMDIHYERFQSEDEARYFILLVKKGCIELSEKETKEFFELERKLEK
ncbi:MAG: hypothetical protein MJ162_01085 [Treponema sp.]|nr:hypothetical protein [Treponema sp.]